MRRLLQNEMEKSYDTGVAGDNNDANDDNDEDDDNYDNYDNDDNDDNDYNDDNDNDTGVAGDDNDDNDDNDYNDDNDNDTGVAGDDKRERREEMERMREHIYKVQKHNHYHQCTPDLISISTRISISTILITLLTY